MHRFSVFGGCLVSDLSLPHLRHGGGDCSDWTLLRSDTAAQSGHRELLGEDQVDAGVAVRCYRIENGYRLEYDDTGTFDILAGGAQIHWHPGADPRPEAVQLDVLGRVVPLALHAGGTLCLHGSAVATAGVGLAFLAPKYHGKSTLAQALVTAGAQLATDDVVAVDLGPPPMMRPGVHSVRLWSDSLERLAPTEAAESLRPGDKRALGVLPDEQLVLEPVPLAGIYLLQPPSLETGSAGAQRTRLAPLAAAVALLRESKLGPLLGKQEAAVLLERVVALAQEVPVYSLEFSRAWEQLPGVVAQLLAWHTPGEQAAPAEVLSA